MQSPGKTAYDEVTYPSAVFPQTHPDRLAALSVLHGGDPRPVEQSRILELGCGDATNLIAMGAALPGCELFGMDLAKGPIDRGLRLIHTLGLSNIHLEQADLAVFKPSGRFDFIIAHGLYSWVPEEVRQRILGICSESLSDQGVAYVSYNAYPGNHLRDLFRGMVRYHLRQFEGTEEKTQQARAFIRVLAASKPKSRLWGDVLAQQSERLKHCVDAALFHDDLGPVNRPFYLHEFAEQAGRHNLAYLCEADIRDSQTDDLSPEAKGLMDQLENANRVTREQYLDFLVGRAFRQTLLVREGALASSADRVTQLRRLLVSGDVRLDPEEAGLQEGRAQEFRGPAGAVIATSHPLAKSALLHLGRHWPQRFGYQELKKAASELAGPSLSRPEMAGTDLDTDLSEFLVRSFEIGFIELHSVRGGFVSQPTERPLASPLARLMIQKGPVVPTFRHQTVKLEDPLSRRLLTLLDGNHDRQALLRELRASGELEETTSNAGKPPATSGGEADFENRLEAALRFFASAGLLVG